MKAANKRVNALLRMAAGRVVAPDDPAEAAEKKANAAANAAIRKLAGRGPK